MNCPKCESQTLPQQKFCRSCGSSLEMTTQPLAGPAVASELPRKPAAELTHGNQRANSWMLWGFIILLAGAAIGVVGKKLIHEDVVSVLGVLLSLVGMFLTVYPFLSPSRTKRKVRSTAESEVLTNVPAPKTLGSESNTEYVPSVTERTTDLLKNSGTKRSNEKESQASQS
jgi:hypothetical protein